MPSALERDLEQFFRKRVRLLGGTMIKLAPIEKGTPDRLVIMPGGRMFLVELKTETGTLEPAQRLWHSKIAALGGRVHTLYGRAGVVEWLRVVTSATDPQKKRGRPRKEPVG